MIMLDFKFTKKQLYDIRKFVADNGYVEGCGKTFGLISEPMIKEFRAKIRIGLFSYREGLKIKKALKGIKLVRYYEEE